MKPKHTPGPWLVKKSFDGRSWFAVTHTVRKDNRVVYRPDVASIYPKLSLVEDIDGQKYEGGIGRVNDLVNPYQNLDLNIVEAEANARLIAAAPEMLEALETLYTRHEIKGLTVRQDEFIRDLIKKAKGEI